MAYDFNTNTFINDMLNSNYLTIMEPISSKTTTSEIDKNPFQKLRELLLLSNSLSEDISWKDAIMALLNKNTIEEPQTESEQDEELFSNVSENYISDIYPTSNSDKENDTSDIYQTSNKENYTSDIHPTSNSDKENNLLLNKNEQHVEVPVSTNVKKPTIVSSNHQENNKEGEVQYIKYLGKTVSIDDVIDTLHKNLNPNDRHQCTGYVGCALQGISRKKGASGAKDPKHLHQLLVQDGWSDVLGPNYKPQKGDVWTVWITPTNGYKNMHSSIYDGEKWLSYDQDLDKGQNKPWFWHTIGTKGVEAHIMRYLPGITKNNELQSEKVNTQITNNKSSINNSERTISNNMLNSIFNTEGDLNFTAKAGTQFGESEATGPYGMKFKYLDPKTFKPLAKKVPFKVGEQVTKEYAEKNAQYYFLKSSKEWLEFLNGFNVTQDQLDALVSFSMGGASTKPGKEFANFVKDNWGNWEAIKNKWKTSAIRDSNGRIQKGLQLRRILESNWFIGDKKPWSWYDKNRKQFNL